MGRVPENADIALELIFRTGVLSSLWHAPHLSIDVESNRNRKLLQLFG